MMTTVRSLLIVGILALGTASAFGAPAGNGGATGETLSRQCSMAVRIQDRSLNREASGDEQMSAAFCFGLVRGVQDTLQTWHRLEPHAPTPIACIPPGVSTSQSIKIVLKYLADNPAQLHLPDTALVALALKSAFACGRN